MGISIMRKLCDEEHLTTVIVPSVAAASRPALLQKIAASIICLRCHPELAGKVCPSCLIPFSVMLNRWGRAKPHADGFCFKCYQRGRRKRIRVALQSLSASYALTHGPGGQG